MDRRMQTKILTHSCPPYALVYTNNGIIIGGCDQRVVSYTENGQVLQQFDYRNGLDHEKEFTVAIRDSFGQSVVFGSFNRFTRNSHPLSQFQLFYYFSSFVSISSISQFFIPYLNYKQFMIFHPLFQFRIL